MVSQNAPSSSSSSILHHFIPSDSNHNNQTHLTQRLDAYFSAMRCHNTLPNIPSLEERMSSSIDLVHHPTTMAVSSDISHTRHLMDLLGTNTESNNQMQQQQKLSLSLGSQMLLSQNHHYSQMSSYNHHYYLKAAQSLLQEVVNISNYETSQNDCIKKLSIKARRAVALSSKLSAEFRNNSFVSEEMQELHMKLAKLVSLLEEVESRYERYYHQMQEVTSSFELIAGAGSARCYTSLALQAMSKHFLSLSNAILSQIYLTKQKIYKNSPSSGGNTRLNPFDQDGNYNRMTLQQIGLLHGQRKAWRPIRGLPETSVVILRAWLFEHFLHPYPTEPEKLILSSQTGLSKNQVSNWFINARVRLWKPMIEEMYKEECVDSSDSDPLVTSGDGVQMTREGHTLHFEE